MNITGINPSSAIAAGSICSFNVTSIRNPISTAVKTGFSLITKASDGGDIDNGDLTLQIGTAATISSGSSEADGDDIVNELATIDLTFAIPVPLDIGCLMYITFPTEMQISTTNLVEVNGFGLFGAKTSIPLSIDTTNNIFTITNACTVYRTTDFDAIIEFIQVVSPLSTQPSSSFTISITTAAGDDIAYIDSDILYTASEGNVGSIDATADDTSVSTSTSVLFSFVPEHKIPVDSQIQVTLPNDLTIDERDSSNCTMTSLSEIQLAAT